MAGKNEAAPRCAKGAKAAVPSGEATLSGEAATIARAGATEERAAVRRKDAEAFDTHTDNAEGTAAKRGKPARRSSKADATRRQLLGAALAVIGEKGYSAATVDEIVEAAGVSKGVAYYHFKSKAAMAESILEEGIDQVIGEFERVAEAAPNAPEALMGMIEAFATRIFENKAFGRFFVSELWREGRVWSGNMRGFEHRLLHLIESQLTRGQAERFIRPEIDAAFEAVALVGMVLTTTLYYLVDDDRPSDVQGGSCTLAEAFSESDVRLAKDAFIERICDFVRHANACPGLLS
ncbi:MAG: TetR/AcrR family transcriptional regulator [Gordonibacter sp.]|uniref:TetR/AcrR family transcriptional regulator n=1 Tax=Gordonibacter sp. TaxID=1968902 RepID=UPI002FC6A23C